LSLLVVAIAVLNTWNAVLQCQLYWCALSTARLHLLLPAGESAAVNQYGSRMTGYTLNDLSLILNTNRLHFSSRLSPGAHTGMNRTELTYHTVRNFYIECKKRTIITELRLTDFFFFFVLLTLHFNITLANDQLDTQFIYFIICLLQSSTCFEQRRAHHQEVKLY